MLEWFDAQPDRYWLLAWIAFGALLLVALAPLVGALFSERIGRRLAGIFPGWLFAALLLVAALAFRWPLFFVPEELSNPDESQIIAGGLALEHDPIYWRSVDGHTHGPLDVYPLLIARLFGLPIGYGSARLVGTLLLTGAVFLLYRTVARFHPEPVARIGCLPAFCLFSFTTFADFAQYSSEYVPLFLLMLGLWLLTADLAAPAARRTRSWSWLGAGVVLGAVPLAKLQGAPAAAILLLTATWVDLTTGSLSWTDRLRRLRLLAFGVILLPLIFAVIIWLTGRVQSVWTAYIAHNLLYIDASKRQLSPLQLAWDFNRFVVVSPGMPTYLGAALWFGGATLLGLPAFSARARQLLGLAAVFFAATFLIVVMPGRHFMHYLLFLVVPVSLMIAALFAGWWELAGPGTGWRSSLQRTILLGFLLSWPIGRQVSDRHNEVHPYVGTLAARQHRPLRLSIQKIQEYASRDEKLGLWGWVPSYYVLSGMAPATREAHTERLIDYSPSMQYYRGRYLKDLQNNAPPVFVDAVGPGNFVYVFRNVAHEHFAELAGYIGENYTLVADLDGTRIYVRNDRVFKTRAP